MDKVTLDKDQLYQLIAFIEKRGFRTPLVIVEILDHFACKVEEKMKANPKLTLDDAMTAAHNDFGVMGFAPIATAYEANVKKKYRTIYSEEQRKVLANPIYVITALLAAFLFYKSYSWTELHNFRHLFGYNDTGVLLYLAMNIGTISLIVKFKQGRKKPNPIINAVLYRNWWVFLMIVAVSAQQPDSHTSQRGLMFLLTLGAIATFSYVICLFTTYAAMKKGCKESAIVYDYLKSING